MGAAQDLRIPAQAHPPTPTLTEAVAYNRGTHLAIRQVSSSFELQTDLQESQEDIPLKYPKAQR